MHIPDAVRMARELLLHHGLPDWSVTVDAAKTRAGVCRPARREIGLSAPITRLHDEAEVRETVLHEIAHALVGAEHGHDAVWRARARSIGCTGERCVAPDAGRVEGPWQGVCPAGHRVSRHRRPTRPSSCSVCVSTFDPRHLLTWTYRGKPVLMHPNYLAEMRALTSGAPPPALLGLGSRVRITAPGPHHHAVGRIVRRARTRFHVEVGGRLLAVPFALVEAVEPNGPGALGSSAGPSAWSSR